MPLLFLTTTPQKLTLPKDLGLKDILINYLEMPTTDGKNALSIKNRFKFSIHIFETFLLQ
jgi:hypothetical protein